MKPRASWGHFLSITNPSRFQGLLEYWDYGYRIILRSFHVSLVSEIQVNLVFWRIKSVWDRAFWTKEHGGLNRRASNTCNLPYPKPWSQNSEAQALQCELDPNPGASGIPLDNRNALYSVPCAQFKPINRAQCLSVEYYQLPNGVFSCTSVLSIQISGAFRGCFYLKRSLKWMQSEICRCS